MSIAVACNLSDGVILGTDSAITVGGIGQLPDGQRQEGILKVYNDAVKVFGVSKQIGVMSVGMAMLGSRTIGSYIREFCITEIEQREVDTVEDLARRLQTFFTERHRQVLAPIAEQQLEVSYDEIPFEKQPKVNMVVAGFSPNEPLSEIWELIVPQPGEGDPVHCRKSQGQFGTDWFGQYEPITRLIKGFAPRLLDKLVDFFGIREEVQSNQEMQGNLSAIIADAEYKIPYDAMPLQQGVDHVKFLLDTVINQTKFTVGAPICGGQVRIAVIDDAGYRFLSPANLAVR